jgi:GT2 family glycosyltransferase
MTPELSVVIPTLGRSAALPRALARLEDQEDAPPFEILLVADAAAPAGTAALRAERPGASAARNLGLRAAQAPIVLLLGDDILASPRLLAEHAAWHARLPDEHVAVLGHVTWATELRRTAFMAWLERGIQTDYASIAGDRAGWGHFYTTNLSLKRSFALEFDEDIPFLYEDLDLGRRLHDRGLDLRFNRAASAGHLHPPTLAEWEARMEAVGRAERAFVAKHPDVTPYFRERLAAASERAAATGPAAPLRRAARAAAAGAIRRVPPTAPLGGARVWAAAEAHFGGRLWPAFQRGWDSSGPK